MNPMYMNPHPQMPQRFHQQHMQMPQRFPQPPQMQMQMIPQQNQQFQVVMTNYGPQIVDMATGQFVQPQGQMQQIQPQQQMQRVNPQQNARLMMGGAPGYQVEPVSEDNRFDTPQRQLIQPQQQQEVQAMRIPNQPNTTVVIEQPKFVPGKKLLKGKSSTFLIRTRPFVESEIQMLDLNVIDGGFSFAAEELYKQAYKNPETKNKIALVANCLLAEVFHDTSLTGMVDELYQADIELVYRFLRSAVDNLATRPDIVFVSEYNQWLTDQVNDILTVYAEGYGIDSFVQDFNDLKIALGNELDLSGTVPIYERVTRGMRNTLISGAAFHKRETEDLDKTGLYLVESSTLVFVKLLSTEFFQDGVPEGDQDGLRLVASLFDHAKVDQFYLMTVDKVIYKAVKKADKEVIVTMVGN